MRTIIISCLVILTVGYALDKKLRSDKKAFYLSMQDLQHLKNDTTSMRITLASLIQWDEIAKSLLEKYPDAADEKRLFAYLYQAQKAFADASYDLTGVYAGSIDPISLHVLKLFFPEQDYAMIPMAIDRFSKELACGLSDQIDARFFEENQLIHAVDCSWPAKKPGIVLPTMERWYLNEADEFRSEKPSGSIQFWEKQLAEVKQNMELADEEKHKKILFWAGLTGHDSGDFLAIAQDYMVQEEVRLEEQIEVRAKLAAAIWDAAIASFDSKYTYLVKRPCMLDHNLKPFIATPNDPGYPSINSAISTTAAVVLSHYFAENKQKWEKLAEECGLSGIWAGIHFPIDHITGKEMGIKVAKAALSR